MARLLARDPEAVAYAVERSCVNKAEVVAADEKEGGVRATLNLGHTFGHAIETGTGYGALLHGEAVAIGTVMAADMSVRLVSCRGALLLMSLRRTCAQSSVVFLSAWLCRRRPPAAKRIHSNKPPTTTKHYTPPTPNKRRAQGWIDRSLLDRTRALLQAANLPVTPPEGMTAQMFRDLMAVDKKVLAGKLRLVLLKGPLGGCVVTGDFDPAKLDETLAAFCKS